MLAKLVVLVVLNLRSYVLSVVLVLGQKKRALYAFDALTTKYLGKVIEDFPDDPEDLLVLRNDLAEVL